jgi:hypothetical protein
MRLYQPPLLGDHHKTGTLFGLASPLYHTWRCYTKDYMTIRSGSTSSSTCVHYIVVFRESERFRRGIGAQNFLAEIELH